MWVMEVYKFYEIQKYMTLTRHVYSSHIDVASLDWWNSLAPADQELIQKTIIDAAVFERQDNRSKNIARLAMLKDKGMQIVEHPDVDAFRAKVAELKNLDVYSAPKVKALLEKIMQATR